MNNSLKLYYVSNKELDKAKAYLDDLSNEIDKQTEYKNISGLSMCINIPFDEESLSIIDRLLENIRLTQNT